MTERKRCEIGMCRNCGEAYVDMGTDAQRLAWMANHGAFCQRPKDIMAGVDIHASELALNALLDMDPATPAN